METSVHHDVSHSLFSVTVAGAMALLTYKEQGGTITFTHTEVPPSVEGKGIGSKLAKAGLEYARENGLKVVARCPFVASYLQRHPEYEDLVRAR